jgi:3-deoxy-D-manno-octulosonic-acid transferase
VVTKAPQQGQMRSRPLMASSLEARRMTRVAERLPLTLAAYQLFTRAATPFAWQILKHRLNRGKEHPARLPERWGESHVPRPKGPLVWVHGASVGEVSTVIPLIERIRKQDFAVLVTSGTVTSAMLAEHRMPAGAIHQFIPLDAPSFVIRFLNHWRPDLALFVESDLWPNFIISTAHRGVPMILVNGRMSDRAFQHWRYLPGTIEALLKRFDLCLVRSTADAERFGELGAPRLDTTGNLKLDVPELPVDESKLTTLGAALVGRIIVAAASTHPGEEAAIIDAHRELKPRFPGLLTILAPRHPERGGGVADIAIAARLSSALRSRGQLPDSGTDVYVCDTVGELGVIYRLAPIVFMGGSLIRHGGQNPVEAIKLGAAILHGPHVSNFAEIYAALDRTRGAELVADASQLSARLSAWLRDSEERKRTVVAAQTTVEALGGALERTSAALEPYLLQLRLRAQVR